MPWQADPHRPIGVGIVGLSASGGWAAMAHVPALASLEEYRLVGGVGSSRESSRRTADALALPRTFVGVDDLVNGADVDLVVVAGDLSDVRTVTATRHPVVRDAVTDEPTSMDSPDQLRADWTHPQFGELVLYDGAGTELDRQQAAPAHTVAAAYRRIADDLREGTHTAPDFTEGAALQRLLADSLTR
jgi:predicted dehydrogenase